MSLNFSIETPVRKLKNTRKELGAIKASFKYTLENEAYAKQKQVTLYYSYHF